MFTKKADVEMMRKLAEGELDALLEEIKNSKAALLKAETVEELIAIRNGVKNLGQNTQAAKESLADAKAAIDKNKQELERHIDGLEKFEQQLSSEVDTRKDNGSELVSKSHEMDNLIEGINEQINLSATTMVQVESVLKAIVDAVKEINVTAQSMKNQVKTFVETAQNVASNITGISSIAEQTNLLALNASIEAARAGEAGKGFAVVAEEIRKLSDGTKELLDNMTQLLSALESASLNTNQEVEATAIGIEKIESKVAEAGKNVGENKAYTENLRKQIEKINALSVSIHQAMKMQQGVSQNSHADVVNDSISVFKQIQDQMDEVMVQLASGVDSIKAVDAELVKLNRSPLLK